METLTIHFSGVLTHFRNVVPGIPHRVVIPNASAVRFGSVKPPDADWVNYCLMPHLAFAIGREVSPGGNIDTFSVPLRGAQLQIANAIPDPPNQLGVREEDGGFALAEFVKDFAYDQDVVMGGKASAYFDIFTGRVMPGKREAQSVSRAQIETDGPPLLQITPFPGSSMTATTKTISGNQLWVFNADVTGREAKAAVAQGTKYDFLLNYLVARGGIPTELTQNLPGMQPPFPLLTTEAVKDELDELGQVVAAFGKLSPEEVKVKLDGTVARLEIEARRDKIRHRIFVEIELTAACSDSHYP